MTKICGLCGDEILTGSVGARSNGGTGNGLCGVCDTKLAEQSFSTLLDYLESLDAPVFIANGDARFIAGNKQARSVAGGDPAEVEGWLFADVFDCVFADSPGGCGKAECCRACLIKDAVTDTMASGRAVTRKPAYLDVNTAKGVQRQSFVISTLKAGDAVLLRMDRN